MGLLFIDKYN